MNHLPEDRIFLKRNYGLLCEKGIRTSADAVEVLRDYMEPFDRECVIVLNLSVKNQPISYFVASISTESTSVVSPKEALKSTILSNAHSIILFHNHPSGSLEPSEEDVIVTAKMIRATQLLDIGFLDHIIVANGKEEYFSFLENDVLHPVAVHYETKIETVSEEIRNVAEKEEKIES